MFWTIILIFVITMFQQHVWPFLNPSSPPTKKPFQNPKTVDLEEKIWEEGVRKICRLLVGVNTL